MAYQTDNLIQNPAQAVTINDTNQGDSKEVAIFLQKNALKSIAEDIRYQFRYLTARIVQGFCYPLFYFAYHTAFDLKINGKEKLKNIKEPVIFVSNHIGFYDSFIFDLFVPPFSRIPPFRFMGTMQVSPWYLKVMKYTGILYLVYLAFGVIRVVYGKGAEVAIQPCVDIINRGGTVAIFPEGKIWVQKHDAEPIGPFKWGAAILAKKTGALVIPVSFKKAGVLTLRDQLIVEIGDAYRVDPYDTPEDLADDMRNKVAELYNK